MSDNSSLASSCPARFTCRLVATERCNIACPWHSEIAYQLALSGIPEEYRAYSVESLPASFQREFDVKVGNIDRFSLDEYVAVFADRRPRNGLFMTSAATGVGKSHTACAVALSFILARTRRALAKGESVGQLVCFVNTVDLLDAIKAGFNDDNARVRADALISRIARAELVILDDLASERPTDFVTERFYSIINGVWTRRNAQTLIVTSNRSLDQVEVLLGERIRSRIDGLCVVVPFSGVDRRRKRYEGGAK